jgi:hypothetical protein
VGNFNRISQAVDEACGACKSLKCNGCQIKADLGDRIALVNGMTKQVISVQRKKDCKTTPSMSAMVLSSIS